METNSSSTRFDLYERVTNEIIKAIEAGAGKYRMPWHCGSIVPRNAGTILPYRGINLIALSSAACVRGFQSRYWATYRQWNKLGAQVRRGEKASVIVFFKREESDHHEEDDNEERGRVVIRGSSVFNANQVDGWREEEVPQGDTIEHLEVVETFVSSLGAAIRYGGSAAYYHKPLDQIHMPDRQKFAGTSARTAAEAFYSVLLHELTHWSGHPKRLNRALSGRFGTSAYAMEELIAEFGAAFLCAELGISVHPRRDHAAYVASWLQVLRRQKTAIVTAAGSATTACRYLREISLAKQRAAEPRSDFSGS